MQEIKFMRSLKSDLPASVVVFLVALPLCLGIGLASTGKPELVFSGIIAGIVGGIIVGSISGSRLGVSGPAAGLVVIVLGALQTLGSFEAFLCAVFLAGIFQLTAGFLGAGMLGYYFPSSVIKGMLAAIGLTLILKEIPHALGYDKDFIGDFALDQPDGHNTFTELYYAFIYNSPGAIFISIVSLVILIIFERPFFKSRAIFKFLQAPLIVVLGGVLINRLFQDLHPEWALSGEHLVQLPVASSLGEFITFFRTPDFGALSNPDTYVVAITLATVASIETLLCVDATDKIDPLRQKTSTDRELKAQGIGNLISGLIGGLPITQVIVRSSANINAGAATKASSIFHGFILLVSALAIPFWLNHVPLASLAAILFMVGYKLSNLSLYKNMYRLGWSQFLPFIATVIGILSTDLLKGIFIGVAVTVIFILRNNYKNAYQSKNDPAERRPVVYLKLAGVVTFLNKASIQLKLESVPPNTKVIIDGTSSVNVDFDILEIIKNFRQYQAPTKMIEVETIGIKESAAVP